MKPLLGRTLQSSDDALDANAVVVMSESLWRARFAADPTMVGRTITLDQHPITVVEIVPAYFHPSVRTLQLSCGFRSGKTAYFLICARGVQQYEN